MRRVELVCALALTVLIVVLHVVRVSRGGALWRDEVSTLATATMPCLACLRWEDVNFVFGIVKAARPRKKGFHPPMPDKERDEESAEFKVTDRRLFTPDGQRRTDVEPEQEKVQPQAAPPPPQRPPVEPPQSPGRPAAAPAERPSAQQGPVSFEHLVLSLATTAMFQLGMVPSPGEEPAEVDLVAAKETIDLLDILQQKTKGNLTEEEEGLLTGSLYELRMVFVEVSRKTGRGR